MYSFNPNEHVDVTLSEQNGKWIMRADINGTKYSGERTTLEDAFKAADRLIYEHARELWLSSLCSAVLAPWAGNLEALC